MRTFLSVCRQYSRISVTMSIASFSRISKARTTPSSGKPRNEPSGF
jgi:hypothetical protein